MNRLQARGLVQVSYAEAITRHLRTEVDQPAWIIGEVIEGDREVRWDDAAGS